MISSWIQTSTTTTNHMEPTLWIKGLHVLLWIVFGILLFCNMAMWASGVYCALNNNRSQQFKSAMIALATIAIICFLVAGDAFALEIKTDVTLASMFASMVFGIIFGGCVSMGKPFEAPKGTQSTSSEEPDEGDCR